MTRTEVIAAFPIATKVRTKADRIGVVTGYATYSVGFIGFRTFLLLATPAGRDMGEFNTSDVTKEN